MKRKALLFFNVVIAIAVMGSVVQAQQQPNPAAQRAGARAGRGQNSVERPLTNQPQPAKPQPNRAVKPANEVPKLTQQQANTANLIERKYLVNLRPQVGLTPAQAEKVSAGIQKFLRMTMRLSLQRTEFMDQMQKLTAEQKGSDGEYQLLMQQLDMNRNQLRRVDDNFYKEVTPDLSPEQRAKLIIYMVETNLQIHQAIEESRRQPTK